MNNTYNYSDYYFHLKTLFPQLAKLNEAELKEIDKGINSRFIINNTNNYLGIAICMLTAGLFTLFIFSSYIDSPLENFSSGLINLVDKYRGLPILPWYITIALLGILFIIFFFPLYSNFTNRGTSLSYKINLIEPSYVVFCTLVVFLVFFCVAITLGNNTIEGKKIFIYAVGVKIGVSILFLVSLLIFLIIVFMPTAEAKSYQLYSENKRLEICMRLLIVLYTLKDYETPYLVTQETINSVTSNIRTSAMILKNFLSKKGKKLEDLKRQYQLNEIAYLVYSMSDCIFLKDQSDLLTFKHKLVEYHNTILKGNILELPRPESGVQILWKKDQSIWNGFILVIIASILFFLFPLMIMGRSMNNFTLEFIFVPLLISFLVWKRNVLEKNLGFLKFLIKR